MKIGTDANLNTCKSEGYLMAEFAVRKLYPNGRKRGMDFDYALLFTATGGYLTHDGNGNMLHPGDTREDIYTVDIFYSLDELLNTYIEHKEGIDSFCGMDEIERFSYGINEHIILNLASDIVMYCGL